MNIGKRLLMLGMVVAGLSVTVLTAPAALAAAKGGPALMTRGGNSSHALYRVVTADSTRGMPGWEIAVLALAAALVISVGDRVLTRARAAGYLARRRSENGITADSS